MHHRRSKKTARYHHGCCGMCQMMRGKGSPGIARRGTRQEMRAPVAEIPDVHGCDVGHWACDGWSPGGVCTHYPDEEGCTCHLHSGLDHCDVHGDPFEDYHHPSPPRFTFGDVFRVA